MSLAIKNLTKKFSDKVVFENFSYDFAQNGIYALIGKSGRGKTTLLRIIAGLDTEYTGEIRREKAAYVFQEYRLFPTLTAIKNITSILWEHPTKEQEQRAKEFLYALGFADADMNLYPEALSGGMKQRVSLGRAILSDKKILLLDEPFKELDDALCAKLCELLEIQAKNRLILLTTHNLRTLGDLEKTVLSLD